jgi:hypothetical protein
MYHLIRKRKGGENMENTSKNNTLNVSEDHQQSLFEEEENMENVEILWTCVDCHESFGEDEEESFEVEGQLYCEDCYENVAVHCEHCDMTYREENAVNADGDWVCEDCLHDHYAACEHCEDYVKHENTINDDNLTLCHGCYEDYYTFCEGCECLVHHDVSCYSERNEANYCEYCYSECGGGDHEDVHDYSYKPSANYLKLRNDGKKPMYLGLELEVEAQSDFSQAVDSVHEFSRGEDHFYLKEDGSLDDGFEVVTHPATLQYHMKNMNWDDICKALSRSGARSHDTTTCGIHIHASKRTLSEVERIKLGIFIHTQQNMVEKIARRGSNHYSQFKSIRNKRKKSHADLRYERNEQELCNCDDCLDTAWSNQKSSKDYKSMGDSTDRYEALNWENAHTVEFRMFKGSLKPATVKASLQFVHACMTFVKTVSSARIAKTVTAWNDFTKYVNDNRKEYSELIAYMTARNIS